MGIRVFLVLLLIPGLLGAQSLPSQAELQTDPLKAARQIQSFFASKPSYSACVAGLKTIAENIAGFDANLIPASKRWSGSAHFEENPRLWMPLMSYSLLNSRFALAELSARYHQQGELKEQDIIWFRAANRLMGVMDEESAYYVDWILNEIGKGSQPKWWKFSSKPPVSSPQFILNPYYFSALEQAQRHQLPNGGVDLDSVVEDGDILLTKAKPLRAVSSFISRLMAGTYGDSRFSHAFVVRKKYGEMIRLEALIEDGTLIRDWEDFKHKELARYSILRIRKEGVGSRGAWLLEAYIRSITQAKRPGRIPYNRKMLEIPKFSAMSALEIQDFLKTTGLCCTNVPRAVADLGSDGKISIPSFRSKISRKDPWAIEQMEMTNGQVLDFPGDFDPAGEPQLISILEYRDPIIAHDSLLSDAVLEFLLDQIDEGSRPIMWPMKAKMLHLAWWLRRQPEILWTWIPKLGPKLKASFGPEMNEASLNFMLALEKPYQILLNELRKRDQAYSAGVSGMPMKWSDLRKALEEIYMSNNGNIHTYFKSKVDLQFSTQLPPLEPGIYVPPF